MPFGGAHAFWLCVPAFGTLCGGQSQPDAAQAHGVQQEAIARLVKRLRELDSIVSEAIEKKL